MRQAMGIAVFAGMIGATLLGLFLTPFFYVLLRALSGNRPLKSHTSTLAGEDDHDPAHAPAPVLTHEAL
jgi:multidrug efflux pump